MSGTAESLVIQNFALHGRRKILWCPDASHAIKGVKNFLFNHGEIRLSPEEVRDFDLDSDLVELQAIKDLVKFQENLEAKLVPKLSEAVLEKAIGKYGKMDVGTTIAIFSRETAAGICFMMSNGGYPQRYSTTAHWIDQVAKWYQIMGARGPLFSFSLKEPEKRDDQIEFLGKFSFYISKTIFSKRQKTALSEGKPVPLEAVQKSILMSTKSVIDLQEEILKDPEVEFFSAGRTLADVIESLNGHLRVYQKNPTPVQVKRFLKIICVSQFLTRVMGSNVAPDDSEFLTEFSDIKKMKELENSEENEDFEHFVDVGFEPGDFQNFEDCAVANSWAYFGAYVLHKTILTNSKCDDCAKVLVAQNHEENHQSVNTLIDFKEWKEKPGQLTRPSELANKLFHIIEALFQSNRNQYYKHNQKNIKQRLVDFMYQQIISKAEFDEIPHKKHLKIIIARFMKGRLFFWANFMNQADKKVMSETKILLNESFASRSTRSKTHPDLK